MLGLSERNSGDSWLWVSKQPSKAANAANRKERGFEDYWAMIEWPIIDEIELVFVHNRSMASSEQLKALIKSHISRDDGHFYSVAMQVAAHEAKLGHGKLAEELRDLIDAAKMRLSQDSSGKLVPIAGGLSSTVKPRGELANLLSSLAKIT